MMTRKKIMPYLSPLAFIMWAQFLIVPFVNASQLTEEEKSFINTYIDHVTYCTKELNKMTPSVALSREEKMTESPEARSLRHEIRSLMSLAELLEDKGSVCVAIFYSERINGIYVSFNKNEQNVRNRMSIIRRYLNPKEPISYNDIVYGLENNSNHCEKIIKHRINRLNCLPKAVKKAIKYNEIEYVDYSLPSKMRKYSFHAEMKLIRYLIDEKIIRQNTKLHGILSISKLCCQSCATGLYAIKKCSSININLNTVGAHGGGYPNVYVPEFIFYKSILPHFLGPGLCNEMYKYCIKNKFNFEKFISFIVNEASFIPEGYKIKTKNHAIYAEVSETTVEHDYSTEDGSSLSEESNDTPVTPLVNPWGIRKPNIPPDNPSHTNIPKPRAYNSVQKYNSKRSS